MNKTSLNTFKWLLWRDVRALRKTFVSQWIDFTCLLCVVVVLNNYIMTTFGMPANFGVYMLVSQMVAGLAWSAVEGAGVLAWDLQGVRAITYELALPITYRLVYLQYVCAYAIKALLINVASMPIAALLIAKQLPLSSISWFKLALILPCASVFFSFFMLCIVMLHKNAETLGRFWMRWGMIIWMFSGQFSPWYIFNKTSVYAGYAVMLNPFIYVFEAAHAAFMGPVMGGSHFINFWLCCIAIVLFGIFFAWAGMYLFKKKLDCV